MESCDTFQLHSVLDCLCVGGPGQCSSLTLSWLQEDEAIFLSRLWKLETWPLSYQESCFGQMFSPHYCQELEDLLILCHYNLKLTYNFAKYLKAYFAPYLHTSHWPRPGLY